MTLPPPTHLASLTQQYKRLYLERYGTLDGAFVQGYGFLAGWGEDDLAQWFSGWLEGLPPVVRGDELRLDKTCIKGRSCGAACIAKTKNCRAGLGGAKKRAADKVAGKKAASGGAAVAAPEAKPPEGVKSRNLKNGGKKYLFEVEDDFGPAEVEVSIADKKGTGSLDVVFSVDGGYSASIMGEGTSRQVADKINQIFRYDISQRPDGTRLETEAWTKDDRGRFREAMYARTGFSLGGGTASKPGGRQYGVVQNGKLVPTDSKGKPLSAAALAQHKSATREALKQGIQEAKETRVKAPRERTQAEWDRLFGD